MATAFVLIKVEVGKARKALEKVKGIEGVVEAYLAAGPYDIVAKVETAFEKITDLVAEKIHGVEGVKETLTLIAFK
ncbi:MAG: Lrp/AsnC family transcriptional regulator [Pyrobaculum sp.]